VASCCGFLRCETLVWAYRATFMGTFIFGFGVEDPAALKFLCGSIAFFAIMSCAFLIYLAVKMTTGDLR
jgi:hypothetical protein